MDLINALEKEKIRESKEDWNKIYLHSDGKFYYAYSWSSWLIKTLVCTEEFQNNRGDERPLVVSHCKIKNYEYTVIGFPKESISKFIPQYKDLKTLDKSTMQITIEIPISNNTNYESLLKSFNGWMLSFPIKETKNSTNPHKKESNIKSDKNSILELIKNSEHYNTFKSLLSHPLETATPEENIKLIRDLKNSFIDLLF
jgi:hypothetical protein